MEDGKELYLGRDGEKRRVLLVLVRCDMPGSVWAFALLGRLLMSEGVLFDPEAANERLCMLWTHSAGSNPGGKSGSAVFC